jgi:hypothetical protein
MTRRRVFRDDCSSKLRVQRPSGILKELGEKDNIKRRAAKRILFGRAAGYLVFSSI